jgi:hypothetical protein
MKGLSESDVEDDPHVAGARDTGGRPADGEWDNHSSTGTSETETYVGRVAGQDSGDAGETGAEARAEAEQQG